MMAAAIHPCAAAATMASNTMMARINVFIARCTLAGLDPTVESPDFEKTGYDWRPIAVSAILIAAIACYDFFSKGTVFGPLNMGLCRGLNLALGMCAGWWWSPEFFSEVTVFSAIKNPSNRIDNAIPIPPVVRRIRELCSTSFAPK